MAVTTGQFERGTGWYNGTEGTAGIVQVKYNGSYVSKVKLNLNPSNNHSHGWETANYLGSETKADHLSTSHNQDTQWNSGYTGTKVLFDYAKTADGSYPNLFPPNPYGYVAGRAGSNSINYSPDYNYYRDGGTVRSQIWHYNYTWQTLGTPHDRGWLPPTMKYSGSSSVNQVISQPVNTDLTMTWYPNVETTETSRMVYAYAYKDYTIYKKPWIGDQTLNATFLTTPNQWYPGPNDGSGGTSRTYGSVVLLQPQMWGSIALTNGTTTTGAGYSDGRTLYGIWQSSYNVQFNVMVYVPLTRWDSLSDLQSVGINWHLDLPGMSPSSQSGVIKNNFVEMSNLPGYYIGHQAITLPEGLNTITAKISFSGPFKWQDSARDNEKTYTLII